MQKEIILKGFTENPSDYECPDGELASAMGLVPEDSTMKPILPPKEMFTLAEGEELLRMVKHTGFQHYIIKIVENVDNVLKLNVYYSNNGTDRTLIKDFSADDDIHDVNSVGNTLILLAESGMYYFLWKDEDYEYLGDHFPELSLSFGLEGAGYVSDSFNIRYDPEVDKIYRLDRLYNDDMKKVVTEQVMARANFFTAEKYTRGNRFIFPFFVRYAYRLYDGSLTMHSAPVLMSCMNYGNPFVLAKEWAGDDNRDTYSNQELRDCHLYGLYYKLCVKMAEANPAAQYVLRRWKDIITSVDIFVSAPIYTLDQSGVCEGCTTTENLFSQEAYCLCKTLPPYSNAYQPLGLDAMAYANFGLMRGGLELPNCAIQLPWQKPTINDIEETSRFYFLASYSLNKLPGNSMEEVNIEKGYFAALVNREIMSDDYGTHDTLFAKRTLTYNGRLHFADISTLFARPFYMESLITYTNGVNDTVSRVPIGLFVFIKSSEGDIVINALDINYSFGVISAGSLIGSATPINFLYYPNVNAFKAIIFTGTYSDYRCYEINLTPHPMLNGAYYFNNWSRNAVVPEGSGAELPTPNNHKIALPNKLYTSEVNNPFFFPVSGIVTIGAANILDISSAAKALSEGQFGQFPLYAFTDEGVWALELSDTGTYKARQPITRDVCISSESITQIDSAVLFATDRGIMMISGSNTICISDELTTNNAFDSTKLPNLDKVLQDYAKEESITYVPFLEYVKGCRMIYDYVHQRIIAFNPKHSYAYVYSLKSKKWGMMYSTIAGTVNSYPNALAVTKEGTTQTVVDYSEDGLEGQEETGLKGVIITRPIKLDEPDTLKTVNTVITRGKFEKGHVKTILYGSRDLENWHLIASSVDHTLRYLHGTPYKYFRIVLLCDLKKGESIISSTIEYTNKYADQIR